MQRACQLVAIHRSTFRYVAHPGDDDPLLAKVKQLAERHPRYGYRRISALVRREERVNQKRIRRLWRKHRLQVQRVRRRRSSRKPPAARLVAAYRGHIWVYDFVEDALTDGTPLRILTVMDEFTREGLAIDVDRTAWAERVIGVLTALIVQHGAPGHLRSDNGPEFVATAVQLWLTQRGVQTLSIDAGKPWQNGNEERFNGTVRDECLNMHCFASLAEAFIRLSAFQKEYNTLRPHSSLGNLAPLMFKTAWYEAQATTQETNIPT
jgi:putative transposase